jgi:hypothetical protein
MSPQSEGRDGGLSSRRQRVRVPWEAQTFLAKQEQALDVLNELELRQEKFLLLVVHGINEEGEGLSVAQAGKRMHLEPAVARKWWRSKYVQDRVREELEVGQAETRLKARRHRDKAIETLVRATDSPAMKPVQVRAAIALLQFGELPESREDTSVAIQVVVNSGLPGNALAAQAKRHAPKVLEIPAERVDEGEYSTVD